MFSAAEREKVETRSTQIQVFIAGSYYHQFMTENIKTNTRIACHKMDLSAIRWHKDTNEQVQG